MAPPIALGLRGLGVGPCLSYSKKLLNMPGVYALWPQWETQGSVITCLTNPAMNGTYTGVTLADNWGPFGWKAPFYDGANDYGNVQTAALAAALNGPQGTLLQWCKVANAAVWTDAADGYSFYCADGTDWNEAISQQKSVVSNTFRWVYRAGGVTDQVNTAGHSDTDWVCWAMTWDKVADELKAWKNGAQSGTTQSTLGTWAGAPTISVIGAASLVPATPWYGWLGPVVLANVAWTPAQVKHASTV